MESEFHFGYLSNSCGNPKQLLRVVHILNISFSLHDLSIPLYSLLNVFRKLKPKSFQDEDGTHSNHIGSHFFSSSSFGIL